MNQTRTPYYTLIHIAEIMGKTVDYVRGLIRQGKLNAVCCSYYSLNLVLVERQEFEAFLVSLEDTYGKTVG